MAVIFSDTFSRPDATVLGNAETGQPWTYYGNILYGITNGEAYGISGNNDDNHVGYDTGNISDVKVEATMSKLAGGQWRAYVVLRAIALDQYIMVQAESSKYVLQKRTLNGWTILQDIFMVPVDGDKITAILDGPNITILVNGIQRAAVTETAYLTGTIFGINVHQYGIDRCRFGDFKIESLITSRARVYQGGGWFPAVAKRFDGTSWIPIKTKAFFNGAWGE